MDSIIVEVETLSEMKLILDYMSDFFNAEIISVVDRGNISLIVYKNVEHPWNKQLEDAIKEKKYMKTHLGMRNEQ